MFHQSVGRNQRTKGFKIKQAFQFALLLAVCFWLLYQIKNSYDKRKGYGGTVENKLSNEHGRIDLGRKGNTGSSDGVEMDSFDGNRVGEGEKKEDRGGGDDELDRNTEEKAEEESFLKGHEHSQENIRNHEEKEDKKLEMQQKESQSNEEDIIDTQVRDGDEPFGLDKDEKDSKENEEESVTNHEEKEDEKEPETQQKEPQNNAEDNTNDRVRNGNEAVGSDEDEFSKGSAEETTLPPIEKESTIVPGQRETGNGANGFQDENGVPQDGQELVSSTHNGTKIDEQAISLNQVTSLGSDNQTGVGENTIRASEGFTNSSQPNDRNDIKMPVDDKVIEKEGVKSDEGSHGSDADGANTDTSADGETSFDSGHNSSINGTSETTQEDVIVKEDSKSIASQQETEGAASLKMLPHAENEFKSEE